MRYIKSYEKLFNSTGKYWRINIEEPYIYVVMDKLKVPIKSQLNVKTALENLFNNTDITLNTSVDKDYILISHRKDPDGNEAWGWWYDSISSIEMIENLNYEYSGEVEITQEEIEKWTLNHESEKYNL